MPARDSLIRRATFVAAVAAFLASFASTLLAAANAPAVHSRVFESRPIQLDRIYHSMQGPTDERVVTLDKGPRRRVWITGLDIEPIDDHGKILDDGQQFICHVNVSHADRAQWAREMEARQKEGRSVPFNWFTLVQGNYSIDFPSGFAMPAYSDQPLRMLWMAQNQDPERKPFGMRIRSRVRYIEDTDLQQPMKPLNKFSWDIRVAAPYQAPSAKTGEHCANGESDAPAAGTKPAGQDAVLHFAVPPGRHVYRSTVQGDSKIPFDTTAHHLSAHLHAYGESMELIDVTAGKSIYKAVATNNSRQTGIELMTDLASEAGIPIYRNHVYELVATYNNTTDHVIDAMAVVYIYYRDKPAQA